jgi:hypothetical protein
VPASVDTGGSNPFENLLSTASVAQLDGPACNPVTLWHLKAERTLLPGAARQSRMKTRRDGSRAC